MGAFSICRCCSSGYYERSDTNLIIFRIVEKPFMTNVEVFAHEVSPFFAIVDPPMIRYILLSSRTASTYHIIRLPVRLISKQG